MLVVFFGAFSWCLENTNCKKVVDSSIDDQSVESSWYVISESKFCQVQNTIIGSECQNQSKMGTPKDTPSIVCPWCKISLQSCFVKFFYKHVYQT